MPKVGPIKRRDFIQYLRQLGYEGPHEGGSHAYMLHGRTKVYIPNPHEGDISKQMLLRILKQAGISRSEWEAL